MSEQRRPREDARLEPVGHEVLMSPALRPRPAPALLFVAVTLAAALAVSCGGSTPAVDGANASQDRASATGAAGAAGHPAAPVGNPSASGSAPADAPVDPGFKIGIMTGTVSQNEEEFRGAQAAARKYGAAVKHVTYPDN